MKTPAPIHLRYRVRFNSHGGYVQLTRNLCESALSKLKSYQDETAQASTIFLGRIATAHRTETAMRHGVGPHAVRLRLTRVGTARSILHETLMNVIPTHIDIALATVITDHKSNLNDDPTDGLSECCQRLWSQHMRWYLRLLAVSAYS